MTHRSRKILLSDGGGGRRTRDLIHTVILPPIANPILDTLDDAACIPYGEETLVVTTDSYVVSPLFFPGGDIGKLAVCGTTNDLAMQGARPLALTLGLILEEGFPVEDLRTIMASIGQAAASIPVAVVAGDTKVVDRGHGNGVYINTAGVGARLPKVHVGAGQARPGDAVIVTGCLGDHGVAILAAREGVAFHTPVTSDVAPLWLLVFPLLSQFPSVHVLRDPTRGGLAAALNDIAQASQVGIRLQERSIPVRPEVRSACDLLGLDPLNIANEGKAVIVCDTGEVDGVLALLRNHPLGAESARIGTVTATPKTRVILETRVGGERIVDTPVGDDLPRIC